MIYKGGGYIVLLLSISFILYVIDIGDNLLKTLIWSLLQPSRSGDEEASDEQKELVDDKEEVFQL